MDSSSEADISMKYSSITVIVCTYNRADDLGFMLSRFAAVRRPERVAVDLVIVDNGSTDHTQDIVEAARSQLSVPVQCVVEPQKGLGAARNRGLAHAQGDIIAFTDDDCIVADDWLIRIVDAFESDPALDIVGGRVELFDPSHFPITVKTSPLIEVMDDWMHPGALILGCNMAMRRVIFDKIGFFDDRFGAGARFKGGEDVDYFYRAHKSHCKLVYKPDIVVNHNHKRIAEAEVHRLLRSYNYADGAILTKFAICGDRFAAKNLYWRSVRLLSGVISHAEATWTLTLRFRLTLLFDLACGAIGFLWQSFRTNAAQKRKLGSEAG